MLKCGHLAACYGVSVHDSTGFAAFQPIFKMTTARIPDNLVHYAARDLLRRAEVIQSPLTRVREISPAPLPADELRTAYPNATVEQWHVTDSAPSAEKKSWLQKLNPFASNDTPSRIASAQLNAQLTNAQPAQLVLAPFVLDTLSAADTLAALAQLPSWFAQDGVLLFATLGAGSMPELVNRNADWLTQVQHLPTIMAMGRRLQDLRFGLPVLDVETVRLGYDDAATLWHDVLQLSPNLQAQSDAEREPWRAQAQAAFEDGVRQLSLEIIYGQVWQPTTAQADDGVRTVSLESLTASLKNRSEGNS